MTQEANGRPARSNGGKPLRSRPTATGTKEKAKTTGLVVGIGACWSESRRSWSRWPWLTSSPASLGA
jgi:hypothetical protein